MAPPSYFDRTQLHHMQLPYWPHVKGPEHEKQHKEIPIQSTTFGPFQGMQLPLLDRDTILEEKAKDYDQFCPPKSPPPPPEQDQFVIQIEPEPCHGRDLTVPMLPPPPTILKHLYLGLSHEGQGAKSYLKARYNSGTPDTRFCSPPTSNSVYAWKLTEKIRSQRGATKPRRETIAGTFASPCGMACRPNYVPYYWA